MVFSSSTTADVAGIKTTSCQKRHARPDVREEAMLHQPLFYRNNQHSVSPILDVHTFVQSSQVQF